MKLTFVTIIPNYWGKGDTPAKSLANAQKESGSKKKVPSILYITNDPECYVDGMGSFCYHPSESVWATKVTPSDEQVELFSPCR